MSKYFKNKFSYNHVFLLTIIAGYLLFLLCFFGMYQKNTEKPFPISINNSYLLELKQNTSDEQRNQVIKTLNQMETLSDIKLIAKENALDYFDIDISTDIAKELTSNNPFHDYISLSINNQTLSDSIINIVNNISHVNQVNILKNEISNLSVQTFNKGKSNSHYIIYFVLLAFILSIIYIGLSLDFERNSNSLKKLLLDGAKPNYLMKNYQKKGLALSFKSWLIALFLFILTFYLLKTTVLQGNLIFSKGFWAIVCLIPLGLIIFVTLFVIYNKIKTIINT